MIIERMDKKIIEKINQYHLQNSDETVQFGKQLGQCFLHYLANQNEKALIVYLNGELGAGKTTLTRGILTQFNHQGAVKSPTYTLVEPYLFEGISVYHFDLYRISDPDELEYMGIRDYFHANSLSLIEWAKQGAEVLPMPDLVVHLSYAAVARNIELEFNDVQLKTEWDKILSAQ